MPDKNELIRKAKVKMARAVPSSGRNLQSVKDKLKLMHKGPSGPRPVTTTPNASKPATSEVPTTHQEKAVELEKLFGVEGAKPIPHQSPNGIGAINPSDSTGSLVTDASFPQGLDGGLSFDDLKAKKYNQSMEYLVPIEWIDFQDSENSNPRGTYNRDTYAVLKDTPSFKALVEDIKETGQQIPGRVRVNEYGLLKVTDGWRRALASRDSGRGVYLCTIKDETDEEAAINALRLNLMREDLPEYNKLFEIKKLNEQFQLTYEVIGKKTGFGSKSYISDCLSIFEVPAVEAALKNKKISISTGRMLARKALKDKLTPQEAARMVSKLVNREIQLQDLKFLDAKSEKQKPKIVHTPEFKLKEDGSFIYPSIRFTPNEMNLRDIEKILNHLAEIEKVLRKELKDRRN